MALLEREFKDFLITAVTDLTSSNTTFGTMPSSTDQNQVPLKIATVYNNGGASAKEASLRIMTRGQTHSESMDLANAIYDAINFLHTCPLTTFNVYYVTGTRPQQSGREEGGGYLTSADYLIRFELL